MRCALIAVQPAAVGRGRTWIPYDRCLIAGAIDIALGDDATGEVVIFGDDIDADAVDLERSCRHISLGWDQQLAQNSSWTAIDEIDAGRRIELVPAVVAERAGRGVGQITACVIRQGRGSGGGHLIEAVERVAAVGVVMPGPRISVVAARRAGNFAAIWYSVSGIRSDREIFRRFIIVLM